MGWFVPETGTLKGMQGVSQSLQKAKMDHHLHSARLPLGHTLILCQGPACFRISLVGHLQQPTFASIAHGFLHA